MFVELQEKWHCRSKGFLRDFVAGHVDITGVNLIVYLV